MKLNATILNSSDPTKMYLVAIGEGDVSVYSNLMSKKAGIGSMYTDILNKVVYQKMASEGKASDWKKLGGSAPTKAGVFSMESSEEVLGRPVYSLQENATIGEDDVVRGTLKYVSGWEEFSSLESQQSGHYVSLYVPLPEGTTSAKMQKDSNDAVTLDDGIIVLLIDDTVRTLKITVTTSAGTLTRTLDLSQLKRL